MVLSFSFLISHCQNVLKDLNVFQLSTLSKFPQSVNHGALIPLGKFIGKFCIYFSQWFG